MIRNQPGKTMNPEKPVILTPYKLFDAHNHIHDERIYPMLDQVMERAQDAGIERMAIKGCSEKDWPKVAGIINRYSNIHLAFGLHPWFIGGRSGQWLQTLADLLTSYPQASVGEIGIDHAVENRADSDQEAVFLAQLELARKLDRPVTIHCRGAWGRLMELLDGFGALPRGMLIHCFGGSPEIAQELVERGASLSFSGSITRPNNKKAGPAIRAVPADRILLETDAPDLMPYNIVDGASCSVMADQHVMPGPTGLDAPSTKINEPANLRYVLAKAAELRGISEAALAELTFRNAERFFDFARRATEPPS